MTGFRSVLNTAIPGTYIKTEYLDTKNFSGDEYNEKLIDTIRYKYRNNRFELIVLSDDYAFNFVEKCYDELFAPVPVVFCGTNAFDIKRLEGKKGFIGVDEHPSFKETIELILNIQPQVKKIFVIHDVSLAGQINSKIFRTESAKVIPKVKFEYLSGLELEKLIEKVKMLSSDSAVFYFASYVNNTAGKSYSSGDALRILASQSTVPIWGGWKFNLGDGIIGGKLINLFEHGAKAGHLCVEILNGRDPSTITKLSPSPNQFMFDDIELQRFKIQDNQLPPESIIINRAPTFYQKNRAEIFTALSIILAIIVVCTLFFLQKSKLNIQKAYNEQLKTEQSLRASQSRLEKALSEIKKLEGIIPICMHCKEIRDDKGAWNQLEKYITEHSEAKFSHGICDKCLQEHYQEYTD